MNCLRDVRTVSEFLHWRTKFKDIEGFLSEPEGFALLKLAEYGPGLGHIVEIGSFLGLSTCWLAAGSMQAGREVIYTVDHHKGSPEHQAGGQFESIEIVETGTTLNRFRENIRSAGVEWFIRNMTGESVDIATKFWTGSIRLLFIDGDHSYEASKADFEAWFPFVVNDGVICFHDVDAWPGVTQFYKELMTYGVWKQLYGVDSLRVVSRVVR